MDQRCYTDNNVLFEQLSLKNKFCNDVPRKNMDVFFLVGKLQETIIQRHKLFEIGTISINNIFLINISHMRKSTDLRTCPSLIYLVNTVTILKREFITKKLFRNNEDSK